LIGLKHFGDLTAGMAAGTLYLVLPYTAFQIGQLHHIWPTAFLLWAIFWYRRPVLSGILLGLAAGSSFVPLVLLPLWIGFYARRGSTRFTIAFLSATALSLGITALALSWDGRLDAVLPTALHSPDWLPWKRPLTESLWTGVHGAYRLPIFVLYIAFLVGVMFWPSPKNLAHLIALSAATLIGLQFWYADRGGAYVLWYLPLIVLMAFRPNLTGHEPPLRTPGEGRLSRWAAFALRRIRPNRVVSSPKELAA
jgi:hypothetical protein